MSASATSIPATAKPALTAAASQCPTAPFPTAVGACAAPKTWATATAPSSAWSKASTQNGKSSSSGKTFNRLAYVGLDGGKIGALTLGLQNTVIQDLMADHFDPLTVGNYAENSWLPVAMGRVRADNAFRYANTLGDLAVIGQWSNGDKWSDRAAGQQMGISLRYTIGQLGLGGAFQKTFGANDSDKRQQVWNLSASYQFEVVKVFAGYFNGKDQTNWVNGIMGRAVDNNSTLDRKDNGYFLAPAGRPPALDHHRRRLL